MKESLWPHFIRGYFDGDGSIILPTKNSRNTVFKITSTNKEFLLFCYNIFEKLGCTNINIEKRNNNAAFNLVVKNKNSILLKNLELFLLFLKTALLFQDHLVTEDVFLIL